MRQHGDGWRHDVAFDEDSATIVENLHQNTDMNYSECVRRLVKIAAIKGDLNSIGRGPEAIAEIDLAKLRSLPERRRANFKSRFTEYLNRRFEEGVRPELLEDSLESWETEAEAWDQLDWYQQQVNQYRAMWDLYGKEPQFGAKYGGLESEVDFGTIFKMYVNARTRNDWDKREAFDHIEEHYGEDMADACTDLWHKVRQADDDGK